MKNHADLWGQTLYSGYLDRKKFFGLKTPFKITLMIFIFRLKTGPNHQYSDLEAEKLVYKPLKLVLDDRFKV